MTIIDAITRADISKPNGYSQVEKIAWLSELDGEIKAEIIDTHEGGDQIPFSGYNEGTAMSTNLLVPAPYDKLYVSYLEMQIDYANNEYGKYNNSKQMFDAAYAAFQAYYNRTNKPISHGRFLF